jgi:hypothetical protein
LDGKTGGRLQKKRNMRQAPQNGLSKTQKNLIAGGGNQGFYRMSNQAMARDAFDSILFLVRAASCDYLLGSIIDELSAKR